MMAASLVPARNGDVLNVTDLSDRPAPVPPVCSRVPAATGDRELQPGSGEDDYLIKP